MMRALLARELRLAWRSGAEILNPLWFFLIVITLFPFGVGAAPQLLAQIAPGVVWVAALLAALLVMDRLFRDDWQDGSLEQLMLLPTPLVAVVLVKVVAHWMMSGLPLLIVSPLAALLLGMSLHDAGVLALTLLLGTPTLSFLGAVGVGLTVGLKRGGVLLSLLVLPLAVPLLIFATAACQAAAAAWQAAVAKISSGTASGSTSRLSRTPPRFRPTVRPTPTAPRKLSVGVPSSKVSASTPASCRLIPSSSAASGETISSGRPLIIQWATTFTSTTATSGVGRSISCSREPSCQSSRNNRSITSSAASSAATHTTPGAICASSCGAAPTPNGNRVMTIRKNQSGLRISAPLRHARRSSRANSARIIARLQRRRRGAGCATDSPAAAAAGGW